MEFCRVEHVDCTTSMNPVGWRIAAASLNEFLAYLGSSDWRERARGYDSSARGGDIMGACIGDTYGFKSKIGGKKFKKESNFNFFEIENSYFFWKDFQKLVDLTWYREIT